MKYNNEQKKKVRNKKNGRIILSYIDAAKEKAKIQFPISVIVSDGFYIVESKMNNDVLP